MFVIAASLCVPGCSPLPKGYGARHNMSWDVSGLWSSPFGDVQRRIPISAQFQTAYTTHGIGGSSLVFASIQSIQPMGV